MWKVLTRRKHLDPRALEDSELARVLDVYDLTALGVGSTLGVGVYVLAGDVAKNAAGPAVVLSFLFAAVASVFAGLCYAEFGARVPRAGSAYTYSYVTMGEFIAFIIGWNLILEYVIGSASVVRGLSMYLDSMANDTMKNAFLSVAPINVSILSPYFDFFAFITSLLLAVVLAVGVKKSSVTNTLFTLVNIAVILFVIIAGSIKADAANWKIRREDIPASVDGGQGGFLPFGMAGVLKGAATCFYGFVGFDCIATTGEEVKKPQRAIPFAIIMSLVIVFLSYFGISTVLTMMVPYYDQNEDAPIPHVFMSVGWPVTKWVVTVGGVFGLCASLFGSMFPLPRIIYSMATDGLLFKFLGMVSSRLHTPLVATLLAGVLTGLMAGLFELSHLVNMMSIGTLLAYTIVAACVLLLRYSGGMNEDGYMLLVTYCENVADEECQPKDAVTYSNNNDNDDDRDDLLNTSSEKSNLFQGQGNMYSIVAMQLFNIPRIRNPTSLTSNIVVAEVSLFCIMCVVTSQSIIQLMDYLSSGNAAAITAVVLEIFIMCLMVVSITVQPKSSRHLPFRAPCVPLLPALSIFINVYLMMMLDVLTWIRFAVWMAIGIVIYLTYGSWKSEERYSGKLTTVGHSTKPAAGHVNSGYVPSETSSDPDETPEVSEKSDKPANGDMKTAAVTHSDSNHVAPISVTEVVKETPKDSPQVNDVLLGRSEKTENDVSFVNELKRNVKQNVRVFGGDSIRSYVSVRDAAVNSVKGSSASVYTSAFVLSECACLDPSSCERIHPKYTEPKNENVVTLIPGLKASQGNGNKDSEEKNLYPDIIVLPFGLEMTVEEHSLNETSDHENSRVSSDSEEYCTPETDDVEDSTGRNSIHTINTSQVGENVLQESHKTSNEEPKVLPQGSVDFQENELMISSTKQRDSDFKDEKREMPTIIAQEDTEPDEENLRSLSFTEKLNTLLKKQYNTKSKQFQANLRGEPQHTHLVSKTEPNHLKHNNHEKLKNTSSVDSSHSEKPLGIKDRLEMLLSQRLVGTIPRLDTGKGIKPFTSVSRLKSSDNLVKNSEVEATAEREDSVLQKQLNGNSERGDVAKGNGDEKSSETEAYTKNELRAKLEDIFSRKERPSFKMSPKTIDSEVPNNDNVEAARNHRILMGEFISSTGKTFSNTHTNELDITESLVPTNLQGPEQNISEKNDSLIQKPVQNTDDHLEDSDNSEMYFDALSNPDLDRSEMR